MKKETIYNLPIFVTTDVKPDPISKLYLMDLDSIEFSLCDCILYDRNGNPNCSIHKGKLQEFYTKPEVLYRSLVQVGLKVKYHNIKNNRPFCNARTVGDQVWLKTEEYITCGNCLRSELVAKKREIAEAQKEFKWDEDKGGFYTFAELQVDLHKVGKIKDLK